MNEHPKPHSPGGQRTGRVESSAAGAVVEGLRGRQAEGVRPEGGGTARFRTSVRNDKPGDADDDGYLDDPATSGDEWRVQRVYVNGQGQLGQIVKVIVYDYTGGNTTSTPYYYGYDVLGNVSVISDNAGDEVDQFEQDAFGNLVSGNWVTRVGHITEQITTKQYDVDLGLYYFSARWYDPLSGRFMEYDKAATVRLVPQGAALYSLAYSLPTKLVDPSGYGASDPPLDFTGCVTAMVHILDAVEGRAAQTCTGRYAQAWDRCEPFFNRHFVKGGDADGTTDLGCKCTDACGAMATISKVHCIRCCVMRHSDICRRALLLHDQGILKKWQDFQAALEIESGLVDCFILGGPVKDLIEAALDECLENLFGNLYKYLHTCTVDGEPYFPEHRERGR